MGPALMCLGAGTTGNSAPLGFGGGKQREVIRCNDHMAQGRWADNSCIDQSYAELRVPHFRRCHCPTCSVLAAHVKQSVEGAVRADSSEAPRARPARACGGHGWVPRQRVSLDKGGAPCAVPALCEKSAVFHHR